MKHILSGKMASSLQGNRNVFSSGIFDDVHSRFESLKSTMRHMTKITLIIVYQDMMVWKLNRSHCIMFLSEFILICALSR
jgi:hypothetical protein